MRDLLIVLDPGAAVDAHEAVAVRDEEAEPRVPREIAVLDAALGAVHDDLVPIEQVPHDRQVRRSVGVHRADDGEAVLLEEGPLLRRECLRHAQRRLACDRTLITEPFGSRTKKRRTPHGSVVIGWTISAPAASARV